MKNKTGKYFKYAIGEIVLVVIGILIALQVNNWNESRKLRQNEILTLNSFVNSINEDLRTYNGLFERRLEIKKKSIDSLKKLIFNKTVVSDSVFMSYYEDTDYDIVGRFDSAPFDALKSNGLNQISNKDLRNDIVNIYQVVLPSFVTFLELPGKEYNHFITELENQFLISTVNSNYDGLGRFTSVPISDNVILDVRLARVLHMQEVKYYNYKSRLESMTSILSDLKDNIEIELNNK